MQEPIGTCVVLTSNEELYKMKLKDIYQPNPLTTVLNPQVTVVDRRVSGTSAIQFAWIDEGSNSGPIADQGVGRVAVEGETQGTTTADKLEFWLDHEMYEVVNGELVLKNEGARMDIFFVREQDAIRLSSETEIENTYKDACSAPVEVNGVIYKGGEESSAGITNAVSLAESTSATTVWITDIDRVKREMTLEDAQAVAVQIGMITYNAFIERADAIVALNSQE